MDFEVIMLPRVDRAILYIFILEGRAILFLSLYIFIHAVLCIRLGFGLLLYTTAASITMGHIDFGEKEEIWKGK